MKWLASVALLSSIALAHDTWVQTNTNIVRVGDAVHIDLMLGNHGNDHRDFKLAGKFSPADGKTLEVIGPDGKRHDLKASMNDVGLAPKEGFWSGRLQPDKPGLYTIVQTSDRVVEHAPTRSIKSAKAFFVASPSLDKVPMENPGFDRVFGHALELVPLSNPVTPMGPGTKLNVKLLFQGKPMAGQRVSFIPRGQVLSETFDSRYERKTDDQGVVSFEPSEGNYYLIVAHHEDSTAGEGHTSTKYAATISLLVPAICPCCGE